MAEESSQEKVHEPTPKRIREYREEGRITQSREVSSAVQLGASLLVFGLMGHEAFSSLLHAARWTIEECVGAGRASLSPIATTTGILHIILPPFAVVCGVMAVASIGAGLAQTQFNWAPKALALKWERLNVPKRIGEAFSPKKLGVNLALSVLKIGAGALVVGLIVKSVMPAIAELCLSSLSASYAFVRDLLWELLASTTLVLAVMAAIDYTWQHRQLREQMKMTHDELRRETEEMEGKPMFKRRRRQMHRDLSLNRIMLEVPNADVVITNPTHLSVALAYTPGTDSAPRVVAKGKDAMALHIRRIARKNSVPILESKPLARILYKRVDVGRPVPTTLFEAVATILAKVYRARRGPRRSAP